MKNIKFIEVGMENFGPYMDPMVLKFEDDQLTLIVGPNGVGKTMALDAIPFTLFGITSKGLKGDDVVNNNTNKNCHTWVEFHIDGTKYIAKRYQKYHKFGGNNLVLNKDGIDIKSGIRDVQPEIEKLICPEKGFMNSLMFGQKVKDFFTDLTDSKQKEIFRKLIGLDNYVEYYKEADARKKEIENLLQDARQNLNVKQELLKESYARISELQDAKKEFDKRKDETLKNIEKNIRDLKKWLLEHKKEMKELEKKDHDPSKIQIELNNLLNNLSNIDVEISRKELDINSQKEAKIHELKQTAEQKKAEISKQESVEKDKIIEEWREKESEIDRDIAALKEVENDKKNQINEHSLKSQYARENIKKIEESVFQTEISTCPICHQKITEHTKEELEKEIKDLKKEIHDHMCSVEELSAHIDDLKRKRQKGEKAKREIDAEAGELLTKLEVEKQGEINQSEARLQEVMNIVEVAANNVINDMKEEMAADRENLSKQIDELKIKYLEVDQVAKEIEKLNEQIRSCETSIRTTENDYKKEEESEYDETQLNGYKARVIETTKAMEKIINDSRDNERKLELAEFWKSAYSPTGIPSMLTDEAIPFMNERVSEYLESLSNGRYIVSFDTQDTIKSGEIRDKIAVNVLDTQTRANQRKQLSGGQTRLVDIATILTLGDLQANNLGIKVNLLIFDEIFDSLDEQNIDYVSKVLTRLKKGRSIYLISHRHQDQLESDNILEIRS
jgi:DNA repair exonuclease SbcCD ATPase subunit